MGNDRDKKYYDAQYRKYFKDRDKREAREAEEFARQEKRRVAPQPPAAAQQAPAQDNVPVGLQFVIVIGWWVAIVLFIMAKCN